MISIKLTQSDLLCHLTDKELKDFQNRPRLVYNLGEFIKYLNQYFQEGDFFVVHGYLKRQTILSRFPVDPDKLLLSRQRSIIEHKILQGRCVCIYSNLNFLMPNVIACGRYQYIIMPNEKL